MRCNSVVNDHVRAPIGSPHAILRSELMGLELVVSSREAELAEGIGKRRYGSAGVAVCGLCVSAGESQLGVTKRGLSDPSFGAR